MKTTKHILSLTVIVAVILSCFTCFSFTVSAAKSPQIVKDGLVAWYDASNNNNGEQDYDATIWRDLSGNRNHLSVRVNDTNYWKDAAYHVDASSYYFPEAVVDTVNSEAYTIEFVAGELTFSATNWITLMCSDNDEFSLFIRVPNGTDTETNLEYKYNDKNADRPKLDNGAEVINNVTVTITFDLTDPDEAMCIIYVDGAAMAQGVPQHTNIADTLTFGHENPQRAWSGDIHGFRFYNRALTPEEVMQNSDADYTKYRSGDYYAPEVEYDDSDEEIAGGVTGDFKNDLIPLTEELELIPTDGFFGTNSIIDAQLYNKEEWTGARFMRTEELEPDGDGNVFSPYFYVNYQKYCRKAGSDRSISAAYRSLFLRGLFILFSAPLFSISVDDYIHP